MSESFVEDDSSKTDLETSTSDQNASNNIESIKRSDSATDPELKVYLILEWTFNAKRFDV